MGNLYEVFTKDELFSALKEKYDYILIKGELVSDIHTIMKGQLSEDEMLGFELGSAGTTSILASVFDAIIDHFSSEKREKIDKDIEKKLKIYKIKQLSKDQILLSLRQLDY